MLNLHPAPREAQLDIDECSNCRENRGWSLADRWIWSAELREAVPLLVWIACPECNADERKPKPWDT